MGSRRFGEMVSIENVIDARKLSRNIAISVLLLLGNTILLASLATSRYFYVGFVHTYLFGTWEHALTKSEWGKIWLIFLDIFVVVWHRFHTYILPPTYRAQLLSIVKIYLFNLTNGFFCSQNDDDVMRSVLVMESVNGNCYQEMWAECLFQFDKSISIISIEVNLRTILF